MEINITKVLDGIFVGDQFVATVSHIIGWSIYPLDLNMQQQGVYHLNITRTIDQNYFPTYYQICNAIRFIQNSKDQCLCCLIYSDKQSDAALILAPYIMFKFKWNLETTLQYIKRKVYIPQISQELYTKLENIQSNIANNHRMKQLKNIEWKYDFLKQYQGQDDQQMIIINTIKNTLRTFSSQQINQFQIKRIKKQRRIQWYDKMPRNSELNKVPIQFPRGSTPMKKSSKQFFTKALNKKTVINGNSVINNNQIQQQNKKAWKSGTSLSKSNKNQDDFFNDDIDFFQLKELSRTNIQDITNNKNRIRKRTSLKQSRSDKNLGSSSGKQNRAFNINNLSFNKKPNNNFLNLNTISAKDFLNNLKNLSKMNLNA